MRLSRLIALDDSRCTDARLVGAKAAGLARARAQGLPVLPGVVVPVGESDASCRRARAALDSGGSGAARLAAMDLELEPGLLDELSAHVQRLGQPVLARSSSPLEGSGHWAGAFSTFHDVSLDELGTAVRGCWSSAFSVDALARADAAGVAPAQLRLAVLIQPQLHCDAGGVAVMLPDGHVEVIGVPDAPGALLGGWTSGTRARVTPQGEVRGGAAIEALGADTLRAAAELAVRVWDAGGFDRVEWARSGQGVSLLQLQRTQTAPCATAPSGAGVLRSATALRVARVAHRWSGPVAERYVLPWALALGGLPDVAGPRSTRPLEDWRRARSLTEDLTRHVWSSADEAHRVLAGLRGLRPEAAFARVDRLATPDRSEAEQALRLLAGVGAALVARGALRAVDDLWRCHPEAIEQALVREGPALPRPRQVRLSRWEPFVHAVVSAHGTALAGAPAVPGIGAGPVRFVRNPHGSGSVGARPVLVADRPLPGLAPLLWHAAGLVTASSNQAAHLLEVAQAVGVPSVTGVDLERLGCSSDVEGPARRVLAAVDGSVGTVTVVDAG